MKLSFLILAITALASAINPIIIKGKFFFDSVTGTQFYMVGVDYQPIPGDPIADLAGLQRDIPYLRQLGVNTIRCYYTDRTVNHDQGMALLAQAGIYLVLDLSTPSESIPSGAPRWDTDLFDSYRGNIDAFLKYDNTLGFIAGNEVILADGTSNAGAFVKASIRDAKAYIASKGSKKPVGYAAADVPVAYDFQSYLDCDSQASSADFYGVNIYRWCGDATLQTSGYADFANRWKDYSIPIVFTEYGCNQPEPRLFNEVLAIYSSPMTDVLSGGLVYEYIQEVNNYGLVQINGNTVTPLQDFNTFKNQVAKINPPRRQMSTYTPTESLQTCPPVTSSFQSASSPLPPQPNHPACACMFKQLNCITSQEDDTNATPDQQKKVGDTLNYICSNYPSACTAIAASSPTGTYGPWSMCNGFEKVSWAMSQYYANYGPSQGSDACSFGGLGNIVTPTTPASTQCQNTPNDFASATPSTGNSGSSTGNSGSSTGNSGSSTGNSATTGNSGTPSTTTSSGSGNTCTKASYCSPTLCACNGACYDQSQYCCQNNQLTQASFCTAPTTANSATTGNSASTTGNSGASTGNSATTGNSGSSTGNSGSTTTNSGTPSTTTSSGSGNTCTKASFCGANLCACGGACYSQSSYCCQNGQLTQLAFCTAATPSTGNSASTTGNSGASTGNSATTGNSGSSTGNSGASTGNSATTGNSGTPSTTTSSGSGNICTKASYCSPTLCACNGACYDQSQYCCQNNQLTQAAFCTAATPSTGNSGGASTTTANANSGASTGNSASTTGNSGASTGNSGTPATGNSGSATCTKASFCGANLCACGGACYDQSQYCCPNGQLTQKAFC